MTSEIVKWDDPALKKVCEDATVAEFPKLKKKMIKALSVEPLGVGLAAPQIGQGKRMILVKKGHHFAPLVMANPVITDKSEDVVTDWEGCLSFPDHYVEIKRHTWVICEYMNKKGNRPKQRFEGFEARVLQHEMDHLDGICLVGDAWRAGTSVSIVEMNRIKKERRDAEANRARLAREAKTKEQSGTCSRTACPNAGEGFYHKDMIKGNPDRYSNYCEDCARRINRENGQQLVLPGPMSGKVQEQLHPGQLAAAWPGISVPELTLFDPRRGKNYKR